MQDANTLFRVTMEHTTYRTGELTRWLPLRDYRQFARLFSPPMTSKWDNISHVISSQYRIAVLQRLSEGPATPSRIAEETDLGIAHISRALRTLRERELVDLLVSEDRRKGRVYGITETGAEIWTQIEDEGMADGIKPSG